MEYQTSNLESKTINHLCFGIDKKQYSFYIPSYQRGYRWDEHVEKLLDDLLGFNLSRNKGKNVGTYYCLQPIITKRMDALDTEGSICYEVVDGQQRLITIHILLKVFGYNKRSFSIFFERDKKDKIRETFLNSIGNNKQTDVNKADFYFMQNAYDKACKWLDEKSEELQLVNLDDRMRQELLDNTQIIWYELSESMDGRNIFRNINYGKLPLTDSELIKAMMLNSKHYALREFGIQGGPDRDSTADTYDKIIRIEQERMARLWDEIERTLQDDGFWAFISDKEDYSTRIDYIFKCIYDQEVLNIEKDEDTIFAYFERFISEGADGALSRIDELWKEVRLYFRTFQDWHSNPLIYNYIGYLTNYGLHNIRTIKVQFETRTKDDFLEWLRNEIKKDLKVTQISELTYEEDRKKIEKLLLLFNIETANKMSSKFDFVVDSGWSVEHVFAQHSIKIPEKDRKDWIEQYMSVVDSAIKTAGTKEKKGLMELKESMKGYLGGSDTEFEALFDKILQSIECKGAEVDNICNLALIGKDDNSALGNSSFYEKRRKIIEMVEEGNNIPPATLHLFMKFYSGTGTNLDYWSEDDGKAYLNRLEHVLGDFCIGEEEGHGRQ